MLRRPVESALAAAIAVVDQATAVDWPPVMDRLFQGIQHKAGMRSPAHPPAHDVTGVDVDHEGHVDEPRPCRDVSEVRHPQHVRCRCVELAVDLIEWTRRGLVADGGLYRLAPDYALQAQLAHQSFHRKRKNLPTFS